MGTTQHGVDGWELVEYERAGDTGLFVYERRMNGGKPEVRHETRYQGLTRRR